MLNLLCVEWDKEKFGQARYEEGREDGRAEGRAEAKCEEVAQIIVNLIENGFSFEETFNLANKSLEDTTLVRMVSEKLTKDGFADRIPKN